MSRYPRPTIDALITRKIRPLGAGHAMVRAAQRRAWANLQCGWPGAAVVREAVSWAAERIDTRPASSVVTDEARGQAAQRGQ